MEMRKFRFQSELRGRGYVFFSRFAHLTPACVGSAVATTIRVQTGPPPVAVNTLPRLRSGVNVYGQAVSLMVSLRPVQRELGLHRRQVPRQQGLVVVSGLRFWQEPEHSNEISVRINVVGLGGLHQ